MGQGRCSKRDDLAGLCVCPDRSLAEPEVKKHGVCPSCGTIFKPFGIKPEWVLRKAYQLQDSACLNRAEEALL